MRGKGSRSLVLQANVKHIEVKGKSLLRNVKIFAGSGQITTIMGPSGAGKSTLLAYIACRVEDQNYSVQGTRTLNGQTYDSRQFSRRACFVQQDDCLWQTLTVRESLKFIARFKGIRNEKKVDELLSVLQLLNCQNSLVGGMFFKSISGGERKRLSIGIELLSDPQIIVLDEPTSGLDSHNALILMQILKNLSRNKIVLQTIHQPSSFIYSLFDRLVILSNGALVYQGSAEGVLEYMGRLGIAFDKEAVPAELVMYQLSPLNQAKRSALSEQNYKLRLESEYQSPPFKAETVSLQDRDEVGLCRVLGIMWSRTFACFKRNTITQLAQILSLALVSVLVTVIYYDLGGEKPSQPNTIDVNFQYLQSILACVFFVQFFCFGASNFEFVLTFPLHRPIVSREVASGCYPVWIYTLVTFVFQFPFKLASSLGITSCMFWLCEIAAGQTIERRWQIFAILGLTNFFLSLCGLSYGGLIGSVCRDIPTAIAFQSITTLPLMAFAGIIVDLKTLPSWIYWFQFVSPLRYSYNLQMRAILLQQKYSVTFMGDEVQINTLEYLGVEGGRALDGGLLLGLGLAIVLLSGVMVWKTTKVSF